MLNKLFSENNKKKVISALFGVLFIEFILTAFFSLGFESDPKNAFLFGYSFSRLALFGFSILLAVWQLCLAFIGSYRTRIIQKLDLFVQNNSFLTAYLVILAFGLAVIIGLTPYEFLGQYGILFTRARVLLFVICLYPVQFSLIFLREKTWDQFKTLIKPGIVSVCILSVLSIFMVLSKWGIVSDKGHWNPAGIPITWLQLSAILWFGWAIFGLIKITKNKLNIQNEIYFDILIILGLFVCTVFLWTKTPIHANEFITKPAAPYFQTYPGSDAVVYDYGALSVLNGAGIFFRHNNDKPLYMVFLAFLHLLAGYDYNFLALLHASFMALMVPLLYLLGRFFHSRFFGFILACIVMVRQVNAISLTAVFNFNVTPLHLMTEVPAQLGLIVLTCVLFMWFKSRHNGNWLALLSGGLLGAVSMIRTNPLLLIPMIPVLAFLSLKGQRKIWVKQSILFLLGCAIVMGPWVGSMRKADGTLIILYDLQNIIKTRYSSLENFDPTQKDTPLASSSAKENIKLQPLSAGLNIPHFSIKTFPGFVINYSLQNFVGAVLTLPDSIQSADQKLELLTKRPYWSDGLDIISVQQIPFLLLNIIFLSLGLGWAWKRWKWIGTLPLFIFMGYSAALALARTSGSRYLVPVDWIMDFYFALGLIVVFHILFEFSNKIPAFQGTEEIGNNLPQTRKIKWMPIGSIFVLVCLASAIPVSQNLIPKQAPICAKGNFKAYLPALQKLGIEPQTTLITGRVLYPQIDKDKLVFNLLTCTKIYQFEITRFQGKLSIGQAIVAGVAGTGSLQHLSVLMFPPSTNQPLNIIWKTP